MMGRIPDEKIQEIRERTDIVEVVGSYLPLKRSGANFTGLCPFHTEKTPSFNVNAPRQIFHCFGCDVGGNVFSFLMRMEGLSFPEAVRRLGERVGVAVEEEEASPAELRHRQEKQRLTRINEIASEFYHRILMEEAEGELARRYLKERGYGRETARLFRLGYAPDGWSALSDHLAGKGFDPRSARELGLIRLGKEGRSDFDLFRRRLIFPIMDVGGAVVAFGGRVLDGSLPKYLNSPESAVYYKSRVLYGLYQAREEMRKSGEAIVVEGYFDQLALVRAGFPQTVASCGTALTAEHARLLKRYAGRLLLLFDQDSAGRKATFRAMDVLLSEGLSAAVVQLDAGEDPDSFLRKHGSEPFRDRLRAARPVLDVFIDAVLTEHGSSIEGKARAIEQIMAKLRLLSSEIEKSLYLKELAGRTGIDPELLARKISTRPDRPLQVSRPRQRQETKTRGAAFKAQEWLLYLMLTDGPSRQRVVLEGVETLFFEENCLAVARQVVGMAGQGEKMDEKRLFDTLDEEQKAILSGILIKDEKAFADDGERIFEDCRLMAAKEKLKRRFRELSDLLRGGDGGDSDEYRTLLQRELIDIKKQLEAR